MWVAVLGPLLIHHEDSLVEVPAAKHRATLAALLVNANRVVSADDLADIVWDGSPPPGARVTARGYIRRLRLLLGPVGCRIVTRPCGYAAEFDAGELDLLRFGELCREGSAAFHTGSWERCSDALGEALGLWRDTPLCDVTCQRLEREQVPQLDQMRLQAAESRAEAELRLGRYDLIVHELQHLVAEQPLRERFHALLMIALARGGRQADALAAYQQARRDLIDELGIEPGPELQQLHQQILQRNPELLGSSSTSRSDNSPGSHQLRMDPVQVAGAESGPRPRAIRRERALSRGRREEDAHAPVIEAAELARSGRPVFQLPAAPADFTGRAAESERLISAITSTQDQPGVPLVAVSGPPGVGKTSLALQVAHTVRARFEDGQLWVDLAGTSMRPRDPGEVLGEFLRALGVPGAQVPADLAGRAADYRSRLAGRRVLVVADDAATVGQVRPLLPGTAGCAMVVTSRARLEGLDGAYLLPLDVLTVDDAVDLLARVVGQDRVGAERAAAGSLARACGGLPLALRITGAKLATRPSWPLSVMVAKIMGAQGRLGELESAEVSVRASIASSYQSLSDRARRAFRLLALLGPTAFAEWTVGALLDEANAADVISELASHSVLTPTGADAGGEPRYRLHDLLREFASERLAGEPAASRDSALHRVLEGWLQLAQLADARLPAEPYFPPAFAPPPPRVVPAEIAEQLVADPNAWFTAERVNLLAAVEQACAVGRLDLAGQLASCQCAFQHYQHRYDDAERLWRGIADSASRLDEPTAAGYARLRVGASMLRSGQSADALPILDEYIHSHDHNGDPGTLAVALYWRSSCALDLYDARSARDGARRGIIAAQRARARLPEALNLCVLGNALAMLGADRQAAQASESALVMARGLGISHELEAQLDLAYTYVLTRSYQPAVAACQRAIEMSLVLGNIGGEAVARGLLGDAYQGLGKYLEAAASLHRALPVFRDHSARRFQAVCLLKLGYAYAAMGSPDAIGYLQESLQVFRQLRIPAGAGRAQQALNDCQAIAAG